MNVFIPISIGELVDKISILKIKKSKITEKSKSDNISKELEALQQIFDSLELDIDSSHNEFLQQLYSINNALWDIEDKIRYLESIKQFDTLFVETARQVYYLNDKRANIKKQINMKYNSDIVEEKSYLSE